MSATFECGRIKKGGIVPNKKCQKPSHLPWRHRLSPPPTLVPFPAFLAYSTNPFFLPVFAPGSHSNINKELFFSPVRSRGVRRRGEGGNGE